MNKNFFHKIRRIKTSEILDIISLIDNGFYDDEINNNNWFNKCEEFRKSAIEVLLQRYINYYQYNERRSKYLDKAFQLYLRHYI